MSSPMALDVNASQLLAHLPQFFRSLESALSEQLQNASRAGASAITITLARTPADDAWMLTLEDNGPGVADPRDLFVAGQSGWDNPAITDPAGLGFFALLGLSQSCTITSRLADGSGWTATLTADVFAGSSFAVQSLPMTTTSDGLLPPSGLTLVSVLKPEAHVDPLLSFDDWTKDSPAWRHAYPLTVTVHRPRRDRRDLTQVTAVTEVIPSCLEALETQGIALSTPAGTLYGSHSTLFSREFLVVWEHHLIKASREDLIHALSTRHRDSGQAVAAALPRALVWILPAHTAVRPQLPERSVLIANAAWHDALQDLADALMQAFAPDSVHQAIAAISSTLPAVVVDFPHFHHPPTLALPHTADLVESLRHAVPLHPFFTLRQAQWMRWAGYRSIRLPDPFDTSGDWRNDNDSAGYEGAQQTLWMRGVPVTRHQAVADALNWHGFWTLCGDPTPGSPVLEVVPQDLTWAPDAVDDWLVIGRATRLAVFQDGQDVGSIAWLASSDATDYLHEEACLIVADTAAGIGYTPNQSLPIPYLLSHNGSGSIYFWDYVVDEELDLSDLEATIFRTAQHTWDAAKFAQRLAQERAATQRAQWKTLVRDLDGMLPLAADDPALQATLASAAQQIRTRLRSDAP